MEQLEVVIKNNTRLTFYRYMQILEKGEWVYHPVEKIMSGMMISFVCSSATYQSILNCNVVYSVIVGSTEYYISYKYESYIIGGGEAKVSTGTINNDNVFFEGSTEKETNNNFKELFYSDSTNGIQRSSKKLMTHINIRETEFGILFLDDIDNNKDISDLTLSESLNSNYYEWIKRLRVFPRSLYIRVVNLSDCDLILKLPPSRKNDNEKVKNRNLTTSTISSAVTPSMHIENNNEKLTARGPISPYSMMNMISGGQWIEFPPETIYGNSIVEFGASCESLFSADFKGNIVYKVSGYAGKVLFSWDFPAGFSPYLMCNGYHNLHNLSISSHYENFNDGKVIFHILDESRPLPIRILSVKAIFSDKFLNILFESNTNEERQERNEDHINQIFGINDQTVGNNRKIEDNLFLQKNNTKNLSNTSSKQVLENDDSNLHAEQVNESYNIFESQYKDISSYFFDYIPPKKIIFEKDNEIFLYEQVNIDNPRVLFSCLLASSNINLHPRYSGNIDSLSLMMEWSVGCEIFKKVWGPDERPILNFNYIGGINDYNIILNSIYPNSCRRNKSIQRIYIGKSFHENKRLNCRFNCFLEKSLNLELNDFKYSNFEISLIGQQLIAQVLSPYLVNHVKSSTLVKNGNSSNISNSSRFSNSSTAFQGFVDHDHIWKYSRLHIRKSKIKNSIDEKDRQGILDFQGTISFLIFHWDDLFYDLFEKKLSKLSSRIQHNFNPDTLLCIIQRVSLLWENKDFEFFDDPLFIQEFIDAGIILCEIIDNCQNRSVLSSLYKLRNSINIKK